MMLASEKLFVELSKVLDLPRSTTELNIRLRTGCPLTVTAEWYPSFECEPMVKQLSQYLLVPIVTKKTIVAPELPAAEVVGFDAWLRARIDSDHVAFMAATSASRRA